MTWLRQIPGVREIEFDGETLPRTSDLIIGTGLAASYDPATRKTTLATNASGLPAGTATYQPLTWNGSAWVGAALNLAQAAAVTGVLGVANGGVPVPANPADDAKVLTASGGTYTWTVAPTGLPALGAANTVLRVNAGGVAVEYAKLTTANLDAAAGIVGTQLSATAAIAASQLAAGGANTVLQGGTPNTWTATPTVTSLAATYIALGADPADAGAIRLSHAMGVYGESNTPGTDRAVLTWGVTANDTVNLGDAGTVTRITGSALHAYAGATQVAQLGVATTDFLAMGDVVASTGYLRVDDSWTLKQRNTLNTADRAVITCSGEGVVFGTTTTTGLTQIKGSTTTIEAGAAQAIVVYSTAGNSALVLDSNGASFGLGIFRAQGALDCQVRNASTGAASYSTRIQGYNGGSWTTGLRVQNVASGNCSVHIGENAGNISLWDATGSFGSGVGVLFGKARTTIPTTAPSGGGLIYWDASGNPWKVDTGGIHVQL